MDIGLFAPTSWPAATRQSLTILGPAAEERGFATLWVAEHVVTFDSHAGRIPSGETGTFDPLIVLTHLAATTSRIRLGTGVTLISQRQPLFLAKEVASLDHLSGGRVDLGVGVGWIREEFEALGLRREDRGRFADRNLALLRTLWLDAVSEHHDDGYELAPCRAYPKPMQQPHVPIHVGGHSDAALQRVARHGQGWYAFGLDVDTFAARRAALREVLEPHGRSLDELQITVCPYQTADNADSVRRYRDAGADQVVLSAADVDESQLLRRLDTLAANVLEAATR